MKVKDIPKWKRLREIFRKVDNNESLSDEEQKILDSEAEFWCMLQKYVTIPLSIISLILSIVAIILK